MAKKVKLILKYRINKSCKSHADEIAPFKTQKPGTGKIYLGNFALPVHHEITNRRKVKQLVIFLPGAFQLYLGLAKLLVLKLQFNLVGIQLVDETL